MTVTLPITVVKGPQSITFTSSPPSNPPIGSNSTVGATASSGLAVAITIDTASAKGACTYSSGTKKVTFEGAGSCIVDANQKGNADYQTAPQQQQRVTVP
ncbi:MAG TPA: hypothetical protein VEI83_15285 [Acidimicrobiales bacterium]|nr:hypothetical protein [Acidimicrobiales bacterium]